MVPVLGVVTQVFLRLLSVFETSWCAPTPTARAYPGTSAPVPVREARRGRAYFLSTYTHTRIFRSLCCPSGRLCATLVCCPLDVFWQTLLTFSVRPVFWIGCTFSMASLTVISLSRLIISWISDATMYFVSFAYGFVLFCPSGGHVPWPSLTAVIFAFCLMYYVLQLSMRPAHHRCRRCGSLLA